MGCFVSTPKDTGENRRRPANIGEVFVFVPCLWIPKPVNFAQSLGNNVTKSSVERLSALRNRIVVMLGHDLLHELEERPASTGHPYYAIFVRILQNICRSFWGWLKLAVRCNTVQFSWVNQEEVHLYL